MINNKEITAVELSPTKKDFYQIWNELIDIAGKLSERWDPSSTNESDPGIVLLKVLTAVADKLNYNIDANTLEAFMPSAAQEESMRKLTEMLGYTMQYYRSAETDVKITYKTSGHDAINKMITIDKFTNIKDIDGSVNYVTLKDINLNGDKTSDVVPCIEGELVTCETDNDDIISMLQLDDNQRYYFPETQIAENGIFVTNINDGSESDPWEMVDNLNTQKLNFQCYKFGFDSREGLPYIQFPENISTIIEDGLRIRYLRTQGANGNISVNTLCKMETPVSWSVEVDTSTAASDRADYYDVNNYSINNISATYTGKNPESINDAYNNYKKTIGTFDTLVTCRDYMNRIYQMTVSDTSGTNLVSNVIVSDIRDDINKAMTLCTFSEHGIEYKTMAKPIYVGDAGNGISENDFNNIKPTEENLGQLYKIVDGNNELKYYARCIFNGNDFEFAIVDTKALTHFDLVIYPFKNIYGLNTRSEYVKSFKYDDTNLVEIKDNLEENKTLSHNFINPNKDDIACIKNYYKLQAKITTTRKVSAIEQADILGKVYAKLYENFNMRKMDFGEEIPYDSILETIENADPRIKSVSLEDPTIITRFCTVGGGEFETTATAYMNSGVTSTTALNVAGDKYYNELALNNILAGKISLFNYDENFKPNYTEVKYPTWKEDGATKEYSIIYPDKEHRIPGTNADNTTTRASQIYSLQSAFEVDEDVKDLKLQDNEVIQFRLPNLKTEKTYPAYTNYYIKLNTAESENTPEVPATMLTLEQFMGRADDSGNTTNSETENWEDKVNAQSAHLLREILEANIIDVSGKTKDERVEIFNQKLASTKAKVLFTKDTNNKYHAYKTWSNQEWPTTSTCPDTFYYLSITKDNISEWRAWIKGTGRNGNLRKGFYIVASQDFERSIGKLVDISHKKYKLLTTVNSLGVDPFTYLYVQQLYDTSNVNATDVEDRYTADGLGQDGVYKGIAANKEYKLGTDEWLLINYTSSTSTEGNETKTKINQYYGPGVIIKPNFELLDSATYHTNHSYVKKDGFNFLDYGKDIEGMFTLGTNEQIEIRDFINATLDDTVSNIYWERQDESPDAYNRVEFVFDEEPVYIEDGTAVPAGTAFDKKTMKYSAYTLKDGEYFYYTDLNKVDIAYYGAGSKIKKTVYTPKIYKYITDNSVTSEDIATSGLSATIPWRSFDFSKSGGLDKKVTIYEYQYINLTAGDTLAAIELMPLDSDAQSHGITSNYRKVVDASYIVATEGDDTGNVKVTPLPPADLGNGMSWEVRSRLEFNMNSTSLQTLHSSQYAKDSIKLLDKNDKVIETIEPHDGKPLSIKANKLVQSSSEALSVTSKKYAEDGHLESETADFQIKVLNLESTISSSGNPISLNNFGNGQYTKLSFVDSITNGSCAYASLNAVVPENRFGLLMAYNIKTNPSDRAIAIRLTKASATDTSVISEPVIYNYANGWWTGVDSEENPNGFGRKITNATVWASEDGVFTVPSSVEDLRALVATGNIYAREVVAEDDEDFQTPGTDKCKKLFRYDSETKKYYEYIKLTSVSKFALGDYGYLTDEGENGVSWAVESDTEDTEFRHIDNQEDYNAFIENRNNLTAEENNSVTGIYRRYARPFADTMTPVALHRYSYHEGDESKNEFMYYRYTALNEINVADYLEQVDNPDYDESDPNSPEKIDAIKSGVSFGKLLDIGGTTTLYCLRQGLNIIKISNSCRIEFYEDSNKIDNLIFGALDIIDATNPINSKLNYNRIDEDTVEAQILKDINKIDLYHNFYYNNVVSSSLGIDLNPNDSEDTLSYASNWYDPNNINNKFVISEIDAATLTTGVIIAKSSRSN